MSSSSLQAICTNYFLAIPHAYGTNTRTQMNHADNIFSVPISLCTLLQTCIILRLTPLIFLRTPLQIISHIGGDIRNKPVIIQLAYNRSRFNHSEPDSFSHDSKHSPHATAHHTKQNIRTLHQFHPKPYEKPADLLNSRSPAFPKHKIWSTLSLPYIHLEHLAAPFIIKLLTYLTK